MMNDKKIKELQEKLGYTFKSEKLLIHALTHTSYANEKGLGHIGSNERLEFLGDAVLELVSSEFFYEKYPDIPEGQLTKMRAGHVCEAALHYCAQRIPLSEYILLGKGEDATGGRQRPSIISDALESVIGAVYLDGGFASAKELVLRFVLNDIEHTRLFYDSKSMLQEEVQKNGNGGPVYEQISEDGPDHNKSFTVRVLMDGEEIGRGTASSKKHAEQQAAMQALVKLEKLQV
jgi:ribonuclease III